MKQRLLTLTLIFSFSMIPIATSAENVPQQAIQNIQDSYLQKFNQIQPSKCDAHYLKMMAYFKKENSKVKPNSILLLGDSITEAFPIKLATNLPLVKRGISGDCVGGNNYRGLLDRIQISCITLKPDKVFILIGINDIIQYFPGLKSDDQKIRLSNYNKIIQIIQEQSPKTKIYITSTFPVVTLANTTRPVTKYNPIIKKWNTALKTLAKKQNIEFFDLHKHLLDKNKKALDKSYTNDGIHLSRLGYQRWIKELKIRLKKDAKIKPSTQPATQKK